MTREKRNILAETRRKLLTQPGIVYTVRCLASHCDCKQFGTECRRGFFSLWIQAVYGIYFANKLAISSYIDFGDKPYLYSDPAKYDGDLNFWNYYYLQSSNLQEGRAVPNNYLENYPLRIWKRHHLRSIHRMVVNHLILNHSVKSYVKSLTDRIENYRTMGVHIRGTDHRSEVEGIPLEDYLKIMKKNAKKFQKFFVLTDHQGALDQMIAEFGKERVIYQQAVRSMDEAAIHTNMEHQDRFQLGLEVLADCYALSLCQKAVLVHSNVSYAALILNPKLPYHLLESPKSRKKRLKTGILYNLDRWGIRKM